MIEGKTSSGFAFSVNENIKKDWRFVKAISMAGSSKGNEITNIEGLVDLITLLLGADGEARLCAHLQQEDGTVPLTLVNAEVKEILGQLGNDAKK